MESKKEVKINFFKKVWYSITKFEQYPTMAMEGLKRAIKYLVILTAIVTVFLTLGSVIQMKILVEDLARYIQDNIPEFSYVDGNLSMQTEENLIIENIETIGIDKIVINTIAENPEQKDQIEKENLVTGTNLFLFKDEIVLEAKTEEGETVRQPFTYSDFIAGYTGGELQEFNKTEFINYLTSDKMYTFYLSYGTTAFISLLIANIIVVLLDVLEIAILGSITATIARIRIKFGAIYSMAAYSLTLPMILNILYIVINYFTNFTITYFQVAYIAIAYIYLAAAIFILKDDVIKKLQEVEKIKQEQLNVREEIKEEQKKKEEEKKDENDEGEETQGSET